MQYEILRGDCIAQMRAMPANSFDSIVTDPPYELGFMGKTWDASGIAYSVEMWAEALRVLKPGGHLLAFSGSRTYHRMTCAIEDAGFEVRDQIMWVYGSGFPKSMNVAKAIESGGGRPEDIRRMQQGGAYEPSGRGRVNYDHGAASAMDGSPAEWQPATDAAREWEGWGTALKPAHEPICVARKPLIGTVAANVLAHGTGAINIDGCRVGTEGSRTNSSGANVLRVGVSSGMTKGTETIVRDCGRWPANLIHDGSDEVVALFPGQAGAAAPVRGTEASAASTGNVTGERARVAGAFHADSGSAARFFYCAKASKSDRGPGNTHPTVKPLALMQYLCRLVTPPGGHILEPFAGSGSTIVAGLREGFHVTGIELLDEHADIADRRAENELYGDIL